MFPVPFLTSKMYIATPSQSTAEGFELRPLTSSQSDSLAVLLELRDKLVSLANDILVLLVLVVWSVRLDYSFTIHTVDCARNSPSGNEASQITKFKSQFHLRLNPLVG